MVRAVRPLVPLAMPNLVSPSHGDPVRPVGQTESPSSSSAVPATSTLTAPENDDCSTSASSASARPSKPPASRPPSCGPSSSSVTSLLRLSPLTGPECPYVRLAVEPILDQEPPPTNG